jgi:Sec-independent protein translocase protein TatA
LALFRIAAAAGILFVLAPEKTREAAVAIFRGAEEAKQAVPTREQVAEAALAYCRRNAEVCADAARKAMDAEKRLRP